MDGQFSGSAGPAEIALVPSRCPFGSPVLAHVQISSHSFGRYGSGESVIQHRPVLFADAAGHFDLVAVQRPEEIARQVITLVGARDVGVFCCK